MGGKKNWFSGVSPGRFAVPWEMFELCFRTYKSTFLDVFSPKGCHNIYRKSKLWSNFGVKTG